MKKIVNLNEDWQICKFQPDPNNTSDIVQKLQSMDVNECYKADMPEQVQEILLRNGVISDPAYPPGPSACIWVGEFDWIYVKNFKCENGSRAFIKFKGLDTFADIYLNGELILRTENMFREFRIDVTGKLRSDNTLAVYFHSPELQRKLVENNTPEKWRGLYPTEKSYRKAYSDFGRFLGAKPYLLTIGIFGDVMLEIIDSDSIEYLDIQTELDRMYEKGIVRICVETLNAGVNMSVRAKIKDDKGAYIDELMLKNDGKGAYIAEISIDKPDLWWPAYCQGKQPLYNISVEMYVGERVCDRVEKYIGFREIKTLSPFEFLINNVPVKVWGANLEPIKGISHRFDAERCSRLLQLAKNANLSTIRVWGGGEMLDDEFYHMADQNGILLWQEFYHQYGMMPETDELMNECRVEAYEMVRRLKHHPSILFWCGGNECFMAADFFHPDEPFLSRELFEKDFLDICNKLDPQRWYYPNSPYLCKETNDPYEGDTHGFHHEDFVRGIEYPILIAENTRNSIPNEKTMRRYFSEDELWPENYTPGMRSYEDDVIPPTWKRLAMPEGKREYLARIANAEKLYDAYDLRSLIYKYGTGHGTYLRDTIERMRRARPSDHDRYGVRRCMGGCVWKFNEPWPQLYSSMTDYYLEPYIAYYYMKRSYSPVLLSFDLNDGVFLWVVNDTARCIEGEIELRLFNTEKNETFYKKSLAAAIPAGDAQMIATLDELVMPSRQHILYASMTGNDGCQFTRAFGYFDIERKIKFPNAKISLSLDGNDLMVKSDKYARSVELSGGGDGLEFGWLFEDNFFDLLPFEERRINVLREGESGIIKARAYFSEHITEFNYKLN